MTDKEGDNEYSSMPEESVAENEEGIGSTSDLERGDGTGPLIAKSKSVDLKYRYKTGTNALNLQGYIIIDHFKKYYLKL